MLIRSESCAHASKNGIVVSNNQRIRMVDDFEFRDKFLNLQLVGAPETVIRRIEVLRDKLKVGHVVSAHALYEMDQPLRRRSMKLFAEEVIPHFRKAAAAA